jgi:pyruvate-ferredoxin/flavodoxin oxidoreductase
MLDTEVYSNAGGQMSKATPLGAVAKLAAAGKLTPTKDLALQAIALANVYVARVAMGSTPSRPRARCARPKRTTGPSLIIAYSHCIAHRYDMRDGLDQQYRATASGHWPLIRYNPWPIAARANCASGPWPTSTPPRPSANWSTSSTRPTCVGRPTRRWSPATPPIHLRRPQGRS